MILITLILIHIIVKTSADEYACLALSPGYGPECNATLGIFGDEGLVVIYEITDISFSTSMFCEGYGARLAESCYNIRYGW